MEVRLGHTGRLMVLVAATFSAARVSGQTIENLSLSRTYGTGVHAYFSGDFDRSYDDLTAAIEAGSEDPRTRYFRGLAALRLGRLDEAEADFSEGADLEAREIGGWPVSRSLERVQGPDRLRLERHRVRARVAALQRDRAAARARYSGIEDAQPDVLRRRRPAPLPAPATESVNPFADRSEPDAAASEPMPSSQPVEPAAETEAPGVEPEPAATEADLAPPVDSPVESPGTTDPVFESPSTDAPVDAAAADGSEAGPATPADAAPAEEPIPDLPFPPPAEGPAGDGTAPGGGQ